MADENYYPFQKEYIGNAIRRAFGDGVEEALGTSHTGAFPDDDYVESVLDDMIRDTKPVNSHNELIQSLEAYIELNFSTINGVVLSDGLARHYWTEEYKQFYDNAIAALAKAKGEL